MPREENEFIFRREADFWTIAFEGTVLRVRHTRGLAMLALLLRQPETDVHVFDLIGGVDGRPGDEPDDRRRRGGRSHVAVPRGDAGPLLDGQARAQYRRRAVELQGELAEAERYNDVGRVAALRAESDLLGAELRRAYGRGGRSRLAAAVVERARVNVRNNLSTTLRIIKRRNEALWRHLDGAVRTGTFCSYRPERSIPWSF